MSIAAPPRPPRGAGGGAGGGVIVGEQPMRRPDTRSPQVMTRRAWWLLALNFLLPGSAQALAGSRRLGRVGLTATLLMWVVVVLAGVAALIWPSLLFTIGTNGFALLVIQLVLLAYAVLWVVLTIDTLRLIRLVNVRRGSRPIVAALAILSLVVGSGGAVYAAQQLLAPAREAIASIFTNNAPPVPPSDGYYNFLLLGADSGLGRDSMRFDSISVVSVNAETGAVHITGIPRDLAYAPFADGPMHDRYPDGFEGHPSQTCGWGPGINQLMNAVEICQPDGGAEIYPDAAAQSSTPAIEATKDAAEGILGIQIPYYVFVDMKGFADIVDALGGVDITVQERLPKGGGPTYEGEPAEDWAIGWIEAGAQHMDGDTAQWYARSRYTTSDWDRMRRQRELQQAILAQANPANVLSRFQAVAAAGEDLVKTDIPDSMLGYLVQLGVKAKEQPVQTLELTPEGAGIDTDEPTADEYAHVRDLIQQALYPPSPTPTPEG
ncbi:LCP family protein [Microbacterium hominis]|uniref:LCP family protein n=1 Tax=Microbacterium TaxID=33882 RepID=UPI00168AC6DB|nr:MULTISPECIES: LCP family protein [Microbacterium]QOC26197.1 LCP family protein [Microbacterium hominis]QOC30156.1 LCP family protein [Microbacterium hominis]QYF97497.1 LCP family protein [Microbacterium sp. PAMC21962]